jgi:hypothetical protein
MPNDEALADVFQTVISDAESHRGLDVGRTFALLERASERLSLEGRGEVPDLMQKLANIYFEGFLHTLASNADFQAQFAAERKRRGV